MRFSRNIVAALLAGAAITFAPTSSHAQTVTIAEPGAEAAANRVTSDIARAMGIARAPKVAVGRTTLPVAEFVPSRVTITLDQTYYPVITGYGADSLNVLAFILGHELGHFAREHQFGGHVWSATTAPAVRSNQQVLERQADELSFFYGHMAGYRPLDVGESFLRKFYAAPSDAGDRTKAQREENLGRRLEILREAETRMRPIAQVFDAAVVLLLAADYTRAGKLFQFISLRFPSPEVLNNEAVAYMMASLQLLPGSNFDYPIEIDHQTRLRSSDINATRGPGDCDQSDLECHKRKAQARALLEEAEAVLKVAIGRYPEYLPARLNVSTVAALLGRPKDALRLVDEAAAMAVTQKVLSTQQSAAILRGILHAEAGDTTAAQREFTDALAEHCHLAAANLAVLRISNGEPAKAERLCGNAAQKPRPNGKRETIADLSHNQMERALDANRRSAVCVPTIDCDRPAAGDLKIVVAGQGSWEGLAIVDDSGFTAMVQTTSNYNGRSANGVKVGNSEAELIAAYGAADRVLASGRRRYYVYHMEQLVFIAESGRIAGWMMVRTHR